MTSLYKNLAVIMMAAVAISAGGAFAFTQNIQTPQGPSEKGGILGHITLVVKDEDGNIKAYRQTDNKVVDNGLKALVRLIHQGANNLETLSKNSTSAGSFTVIGVGTGSSTAPSQNQRVLESQRANKIGISTPSPYTSTSTTNVTSTCCGVQIQATWPAGKLANATSNPASIVEAGLFDNVANASSSSNMFARQTFGSISIGTSDTLQVTWTISYTSVN